MSVIELHGGLLVEDEALALALDLERRGHMLTADTGALFVSEPSSLTEQDRAAIRRLKFHLLAIVTYDIPADPVGR